MNKLILATTGLLVLTGCSDDQDKKLITPDQMQENKRNIQVFNDVQGVDEGNWFVMDPELDSVEGVSSERAMADFKLKHEKEIIVAVLDSGVDIEHEDLQGKIWFNPGETGVDENGVDKATNGLDDDGNGYVDDIHGWNYLGGENGEHITKETLEMTREIVRFEARMAKGEVLTKKEQEYFEAVKKAYKEEKEGAESVLARVLPEEPAVAQAKETLKEKLGLEDYSKASLEEIKSTDTDVVAAKTTLLDVIKKYRSVDRFYRIIDYYTDVTKYYLNKEFNPRSIAGDDPSDFSDTKYGNNDVKGPDASHGTHVAGIIAGVRNNGIGINGVAENVKIMSLRMVPDGDERDKDIALAVRYAVDNGAHIINMSFGKSFSPYKPQVDEAFLYAAKKGVLVFHSAGNGASDNDSVPGFPNRTVINAIERDLPTQVSTWLEIGASAQNKGLDLVASFSDYGKKDVDLFSPGYRMNSTVPGNEYAVYSGTSMASPAAAGVAALLMSNFPNMNAMQAKAILLDQVRLHPGLRVRLPGGQDLDLPVPFSGLSASGGIIDALASVALAAELSGE